MDNGNTKNDPRGLTERQLITLLLALIGCIFAAVLLWQIRWLRLQPQETGEIGYEDEIITDNYNNKCITIHKDGDEFYARMPGSDIKWDITDGTENLSHIKDGDNEVYADITIRVGGVAGITEMDIDRIRSYKKERIR